MTVSLTENCPICNVRLKKLEKREDGDYFDCGRCGPYFMTGGAVSLLRGTLTDDRPEIPRIKAVLSHAIWRMSGGKSWARFDSALLERIIKEDWLPALPEQVNNLVRWLGDHRRPGEEVDDLSPESFQTIIGAESIKGAVFVIRHLYGDGVIEGIVAEALGREFSVMDAKLTFHGWTRYDQLKRGAIDSRKAFMAMEYGDAELEAMFEKFREAVKQTGFDLVRLDQSPRAGLIDDNLRVEILTSRFLISDLTHDNGGAYWEAGFAEGLGKPVIYTCKKTVFDKKPTHFDANHHLTVLWNPQLIEQAVKELKATIRATLPAEAKMSD